MLAFLLRALASMLLLRLVRATMHATEGVRGIVSAAVVRMCDGARTAHADGKQACADATRFEGALSESGRRLSPAEADPWPVLEGEALRQHPDPLGALQRGEVPALMLRSFVPRGDLRTMLTRMAQLTVRMFACRFSVNVSATDLLRKSRALRRDSNDSFCLALNRHAAAAQLSWPHWCTLLANVEHDCAQQLAAADGDELPECAALRARHPVFHRCRHDYGRARRTTFTRLRVDRVVRLAAREFGQKLYGNLQPASKRRFMQGAGAINALHELLARGCDGRFCSPKRAMLAGVAELARQSRRISRQAEEHPGEFHSPGTVRAMTNGWATPLHMDSKHSSAFAALRRELCGEKVALSLQTSPAEASRFRALTRHRFAASAILTLHAPNRSSNPTDLNIFRHRWPALLDNCSVRAVDAYGVGARFRRDTLPPRVLENPLELHADPGDLFLFNSEFFQ